MLHYKTKFEQFLRIKSQPNEHEIHLFKRAQKYIKKLSKIPGIEMIAIVNSLSMHATHKDSDIDLFIITKPNMIWFVRFFTTLILWIHRVWRKNEDIAGNFCLSFFITNEAQDLSKIAIQDDIYLYYWIYYMKPIYIKNNSYEDFLKANTWVDIDEKQKIENQKYILHPVSFFFYEFFVSISEYFRKKFQTVGAKASFGNLENRAKNRYQNEVEKRQTFGTFSHKSTLKYYEIFKERSYIQINNLIKLILLPHTLKNYHKLGKPEGIIISDSMLKFHNQDQRKTVRDNIFEKNFDK